MRCVILQPSYIPWRGYFDLMRRADVFVFYDDVQYDTRGWRNRNRIKTPGGTRWLTIPVHARGAQARHITIDQIPVAGVDWIDDHLNLLRRSYHPAPHFHDQWPWIEALYRDAPSLLADFTIGSLLTIASRLGIEQTRFLRSSSIDGVEGSKTERLISILKRVQADAYLTGPSAAGYLDARLFDDAGIALEWMTYDYPPYEQLYPPYDPAVSILDLFFMSGDAAPGRIWSVH